MNKNNICSLILFTIIIILISCSIVLDYKNGLLGQGIALISTCFLYKLYKGNSRKLLYSNIVVFSFLGMLLSIPLKPILGINMDMYLYAILLAIYICMWSIDFIKNIKKFNFKNLTKPVNLFAIMFASYMYISILWVADIKEAILKLFFYTIVIFYSIMLINENKCKEDIKFTLKILKWIAIVLVILGIFKVITGIQIEGKSTYVNLFEGIENVKEPYNRIPSLFYYNPNDYSVVAMLILVSFTIKFLYDKTSKEKIFSISMIVGAQINIFFTRSRTGWIAAIATLIFIAIFLAIKRQKQLMLRAITIGFIVIISFNITLRIPKLGDYTQKMNEIISSEESNGEENKIEIGSEGSINVRSTLITNTIECVFKEKKYFGVGVGNGNIYQKERDNTHRRYDTHNWWFEILLEFGIPGFTMFFLFYLLVALKFMMRYKAEKDEFNNKMILMSLSTLAGTSLGVFGPSSVYRFIPFWTVLAFAVIVYNVIIQKTNVEKNI